MHCHVAPRAAVFRADGSTYCTPKELITKLDAHGIDKAVLLPMVSPECNHRAVPTEIVLEIADTFPDRFIPFCNIDPRQITNSSNANFLPHLKYYKAAGCRGLGEMTANLAIDNPLYQNLFRQCEEVGMPVLFHLSPQIGVGYGLMDDLGLPRLEAVLNDFPRLTVIGHSQPFWAEMSADVTEETRGGYPDGPITPGRVPELLKTCDNLFGDLSASSGFNAVSRDPEYGYRFLEEFQDKLLFGSDISGPTVEVPLAVFLREAVQHGKISRVAFEKITWRNANKILSLELE